MVVNKTLVVVSDSSLHTNKKQVLITREVHDRGRCLSYYGRQDVGVFVHAHIQVSSDSVTFIFCNTNGSQHIWNITLCVPRFWFVECFDICLSEMYIIVFSIYCNAVISNLNACYEYIFTCMTFCEIQFRNQICWRNAFTKG